jgi:hypothetical protein
MTRLSVKWIATSSDLSGPSLTVLGAPGGAMTQTAPGTYAFSGALAASLDTTGKFAVVPVGSGPVPTNPASVTCQTSSGGSKSSTVQFQ